MKKFDRFKEQVLAKAIARDACLQGYENAESCKTFEQLFSVIKDNFCWCAINLIDAEFYRKYKAEFIANNIYYNEHVDNGFTIIENCIGTVGGFSVVVAKDAKVIALNHATVFGLGESMIEANNNTRIMAADKCEVHARHYSTVHAVGWAKVYAEGFARVLFRGGGVIGIER